MKCLSFNCKGMASGSKKLASHIIFEIELVDIILLQETLGSADHITSSLNTISLGWNYLALDIVGDLVALPLDTIPVPSELLHLGEAMVSWG